MIKKWKEINYLTQHSAQRYERQRCRENNNAVPCYNGNISATTWKYKGQTNGYVYNYDGLNRLTKSYAILNNTYQTSIYLENFTYDKHGNIKTIERSNDILLFDGVDLSYNGNQLQQAYDTQGNSYIYNLKEYRDFDPSDHYQIKFTYDANGNMISDFDRDIVAFRYNLLNLPDTVQFRNGNQIINRYATDGRKMKTDYLTAIVPLTVQLGNTVSLSPSNIERSGTVYNGNKEYRYDDSSGGYLLQRVHNPEGYVMFEPAILRGMNIYYHRDHLGNNCEVLMVGYVLGIKPYKSIVQRTQYYPSGLPWIDGTSPGWQPYKFGGKEFIEMHGYDAYDFEWRSLHSATMRTTTRDRLTEKYPWISPYAYALNNPVKYIDPDGQVVRLANNYAGGMENIAKIAATSLGSQVMSHLIGQRGTYTMNSTFWTRSSVYNSNNGDINYVGNPWYSEIGGGAFNSMIAMGHETFHAFDNSIGVFNSSNADYRKDIVEPRAVSFENYLRQSYSLSPLREGYGNIQGNFRQFGSNEKISDFTTLGNNSDKTSYGFSYTKTTTIVESYKSGFLGIKIPDKTRTETSTHFMIVSRDKNNNASFQIYDDEEAYRRATYNW